MFAFGPGRSYYCWSSCSFTAPNSSYSSSNTSSSPNSSDSQSDASYISNSSYSTFNASSSAKSYNSSSNASSSPNCSFSPHKASSSILNWIDVFPLDSKHCQCSEYTLGHVAHLPAVSTVNILCFQLLGNNFYRLIFISMFLRLSEAGQCPMSNKVSSTWGFYGGTLGWKESWTLCELHLCARVLLLLDVCFRFAANPRPPASNFFEAHRQLSFHICIGIYNNRSPWTWSKTSFIW